MFEDGEENGGGGIVGTSLGANPVAALTGCSTLLPTSDPHGRGGENGTACRDELRVWCLGQCRSHYRLSILMPIHQHFPLERRKRVGDACWRRQDGRKHSCSTLKQRNVNSRQLAVPQAGPCVRLGDQG